MPVLAATVMRLSIPCDATTPKLPVIDESCTTGADPLPMFTRFTPVPPPGETFGMSTSALLSEPPL